MNLFENRTIVIATKHHKDSVIAPILKKEFNLNCIVSKKLDTDRFGTFTGEIERILSPYKAAKMKCLDAMEMYNCDLAVSNEGSFGPHPSYFFINADDEIILFIDKKNDIEIAVREISTETNFNGKYVKNNHELFEFSKKVQFPSHGIILRKSKEENIDIIKDIEDYNNLQMHYEKLYKKYGVVYAETDMRAHKNPSRMSVIEKTCLKLVETMKSECPNCHYPGFRITDVLRGLPCELCGNETKSIKSHIYICNKCQYKITIDYPHDKKVEDPGFCDYCNP